MYEVLETTELTLVVGADWVQIAIRAPLEKEISFQMILNPLNMQEVCLVVEIGKVIVKLQQPPHDSCRR